MTDAERIDAYWARFLGVPASALRTPGVVVAPHAALRGYRGVWFFVRGRSAVVSAPDDLLEHVGKHLGSTPAEELLASAKRVVGARAGTIVGPSFQGWLAADGFRPVATQGVRPLRDSDAAAAAAFRASCPEEDWAHGGIDLARGDTWASFHGSAVVALGQLRPRAHGAVDPCVVTHPHHRSRGHALRLVGAMAEHALAHDRLVLYQTLLANGHACALARRLGFTQYATLLAVRLDAPDAPRAR